jgi:hypothetical protein
MFLTDLIHSARRLEEQFERELKELLHHFPHHRYHRHHERDVILFEFQFCNASILQPQFMKKLIGPFSGKLVFKNAEGQVLDISNVTGFVLVVNDETIGNVALNPDGTFSGNGIAAGDLVITANATNDAGAVVTGQATIGFHADTTVTEIDVNVD